MNHLGRALTEYDDPPVNVLFVYNCNPAATVPDQRRIIRGLEREDLFTVVFEQVMTDTALYADVVLPGDDVPRGLRFREGATARSTSTSAGRSSTRSAKRGRTPTCSASCARGSGCSKDDEPTGELDLMVTVLDAAAAARSATTCAPAPSPTPPCGPAPVQFVDVFPNTPDRQGRPLPGGARRQRRRWASIASSRIPATERYPLALISPASERTISSTLGELPRPDVKLLMHPDDARGARAGGRAIWCGSSTSSAKCIAR